MTTSRMASKVLPLSKRRLFIVAKVSRRYLQAKKGSGKQKKKISYMFGALGVWPCTKAQVVTFTLPDSGLIAEQAYSQLAQPPPKQKKTARDQEPKPGEPRTARAAQGARSAARARRGGEEGALDSTTCC